MLRNCRRSVRTSRWALALLAALALGQAACTPAGTVIGAGAVAGTASQTERGIVGVARDTRIQTEINHYLFQKNVDLFGAVGLSVSEARVLLTGKVGKTQDRIEASRLAWQAEGVREVINEIQVVDKSDIVDAARDAWITTQLNTKLLFDKEIMSINYTVDTVNGVVYLFGIAQSAGEHGRVLGHARAINYVRNVVSYVRVPAS